MDPDLRDLLIAWTGGELDPEHGERLLSRLRDEPEFRLAFVAEIRLLGMLKAVQSAEPRWLRLEDELGWSVHPPDATDAQGVVEGFARRLAEADAGGRTGRPRRRLAAAGVAAAVLAAMGAGWIAGSRRDGTQPRLDGVVAIQDAAPPEEDGRGRPAEGSPVAVVIRQESAEWEGEGLRVGALLGKGRYRLRSGRITLSMFNGVRIVVEGPADLDLQSVDRVHCRRGRLRARIPEGAEGFVVTGPGAAVVDLGTEFALNLSPDGAARGRVFRGRVEASVLGAAGTPERTRVLDESRSFEIDRAVVEVEDDQDEDDSARGFARPSVLDAGPLALPDDYPRIVLEDAPTSYWRFERLEGGRVPNEVAGAPDLTAHGPVRLAGGPGNRCAEFTAEDTSQFFSASSTWSAPGGPGYAVELWFLSEWIAHATLAALVTEPDTNRHSLLLELTSRNRLTLHKPASVRFLHRSPPGYSGGDTVFTEPFYVPFRWHHLVGQVDGDRMEVYLDGRPTPALSVASETADLAGQILFGRLTTIPVHNPGHSRPFYGRMDEIAVYDHALTLDRIRRRYELGAGVPPSRASIPTDGDDARIR